VRVCLHGRGSRLIFLAQWAFPTPFISRLSCLSRSSCARMVNYLSIKNSHFRNPAPPLPERARKESLFLCRWQLTHISEFQTPCEYSRANCFTCRLSRIYLSPNENAPIESTTPLREICTCVLTLQMILFILNILFYLNCFCKHFYVALKFNQFLFIVYNFAL